MRFIRGLDEKAQTKFSEYSIKTIRFEADKIYYSVPPDKTEREKYRPRLIMELESRRIHGARVYPHVAQLVISLRELEEMHEALTNGLLDSFHALVENDLFDKNRKKKIKTTA